MSAIIVNAAPMTYPLGTNDVSTAQVPREAEALPTHLVKTYLYTQKGPAYPVLCSGAERVRIYGADSFNPLKKWHNHATVFSNIFAAAGNAEMIQRIIPADAGPESNLLLSLDIVQDEIDDYERNSDGSIKEDAITGNKVSLGKIPGTRYKWVVSHINTTADMQTKFGKQTIKPGTMVSTAAGATQSQSYPILEFKASSIGSWANNVGIRLWAPNTQSNGGVDTRVMANGGAYPLRLAVIKRNSETSSPTVVENMFGEQYVDVVFKPGFLHPNTENPLHIGNENSFLNRYQNLSDPGYPVFEGDFGTVAVYQSNIDTIVNMLYTAEKAYVDTNSIASSFVDFTGAEGEQYLFNILTGQSSSGYLYHTFVQDTSATLALNEYTNMYAAGGSDGTMSNAAFADAVSAAVKEYNNPNSPLLDTAYYPEAFIYDSGFPMQTKKDLLNFIAIRKDTFVMLSCYEHGGPKLTALQENSVAVSLRAYASMFPESEFFGTGTCRALIMGRDGKLRSSQVDYRVPVLAEVARKAAEYMGAANGVWRNGEDFDGAPGSIIENMYDINVSYTPASARYRDWDAGLNWVQNYDRSSKFIPALKTVYSEDTSVLTGFLTCCAIVEINKVTERAWRHFSGTQKLTNAQLAQRVNDFISERLQGRFDGRFIIQPETYFTTADLARGYSFTVKVKIYAPNMKTVATTYVEAYRRDSLTNQ